MKQPKPKKKKVHRRRADDLPIVSLAEAIKRLGNDEVYEKAGKWMPAKELKD